MLLLPTIIHCNFFEAQSAEEKLQCIIENNARRRSALFKNNERQQASRITYPSNKLDGYVMSDAFWSSLFYGNNNIIMSCRVMPG